MARISAAPNRSSRNVRNGPSPLQTRIAGLLREARWILFAALAAWLVLVLATWSATDPAWSQAVPSTVTLNKGGTLGAYVADLLLFLFGYSAWLWVVLLAYRVAVGFYRLTGSNVPDDSNDPLPRVRWEVGIGFALMFMGLMGTEAMQLTQSWSFLPAGAGGELGKLLARGLSYSLGATGSALF